MPAREKSVDNAIKREVGKLRRTFINKYHGNALSMRGHPDLYGVIPIHYVDVIIDGEVVRAKLAEPVGAAFFIESKQVGKKSTPVQRAVQRKLSKTGAAVGEAHSWEEAREILARLIDYYGSTKG